MSFGFSNVPSVFMRLMTQVLHSYLNKVLVVYFDENLVYTLYIKCETCVLEHVKVEGRY